jgi:hypothetical protein
VERSSNGPREYAYGVNYSNFEAFALIGTCDDEVHNSQFFKILDVLKNYQRHTFTCLSDPDRH